MTLFVLSAISTNLKPSVSKHSASSACKTKEKKNRIQSWCWVKLRPHISQKDIDEVLTTIVSSLSSQVLGGYAQPIETLLEKPYFLYFCCGQRAMLHLNAPSSSHRSVICHDGHVCHITSHVTYQAIGHVINYAASLVDMSIS